MGNSGDTPKVPGNMRKIFRRLAIRSKQLVGIAHSQADLDYIYLNDLRLSGYFETVAWVEGKIVVSLHDRSQLSARSYPHSDCYTLKQVFVDREYEPLVSIFQSNGLDLRNLKIIDAGANVGYTAAYFFLKFPGSRVACVEPDEANHAELRANLKKHIADAHLTTFQNGILDDDGRDLMTDRGFRDGKDHSVTVAEATAVTGLKSISISGVMANMGWKEIDILKMDIEGAERFVFKNNETASFLRNVRTVAIEIHDEVAVRDEIYAVLRNYGFVLFDVNETTFGLNRHISQLN